MSDIIERATDQDRLDEHDTLPPSMEPAADGTVTPPTDFRGILRRLGPGLIIAGSIVGSGELIATTKTGAQAGIMLLWLIVIGCVIKVFVQIELGRYTIGHGETTLAALDRVPGPRLRVNWIVWFWLLMMIAGIGQLGGIVGGVGQAMAISFPLTGDYADAIRMPSVAELKRYHTWNGPLLSEWDLMLSLGWSDADEEDLEQAGFSPEEAEWVRSTVGSTGRRLDELDAATPGLGAQLVAAAESLDTAVKGAADARQSRSESAEATGPLQEEVAQARRSLRELLRRANMAHLEAGASDPAGGTDAEAARRFAELSETQRERLLRGHAILSTQLADLDRDDHRATEALVAVIRLTEAEQARGGAERALGEAETSERNGETASAGLGETRKRLELAQADVDYRKNVANVLVEPPTSDDKYWAGLVALLTVALLYRGKYRLIQNVSTVLVVLFTFITIGNVVALQSTEQFHISMSHFLQGFSFGLPEEAGGITPVATALATFGIIGVGASELVSYPYWCLEKGYAKFTGARSDDPRWAARARGWMKVMRYDAFLSMVVYTIATVAFFMMGVAVLYNEGRDPDGMRMVSTLATAYVPVFGEHAKWLFLIGAIAVLYSTFLVANAGHARTLTDSLKIFRLLDSRSQKAHDRSISAFSVGVPLLCFVVFWSGINPVRAILLAGAMQALLLPMLGVGALYFRYTRTDGRIKPGPVWDALLIVSFLGLLVAGTYGAYQQIVKFF